MVVLRTIREDQFTIKSIMLDGSLLVVGGKWMGKISRSSWELNMEARTFVVIDFPAPAIDDLQDMWS